MRNTSFDESSIRAEIPVSSIRLPGPNFHQKPSMSFTHPATSVKVVIENEWWDGKQWVNNGYIIIPLNEYPQHCSNSFPPILRVSTSRNKLKKWVRNQRFRDERS